MMQEKILAGEAPEIDEALERFKELPGSQGLCRYALKADVSYRLCSRLFRCSAWEFGQFMQDALDQKLTKAPGAPQLLRKKGKGLRRSEVGWGIGKRLTQTAPAAQNGAAVFS